jgi:hypothetical protein
MIQSIGTIVLCTSVAVPVFPSPPFGSPSFGKAPRPSSATTSTHLDLTPPPAREVPAGRQFPSLPAARLGNETPHGAKSMASVSSAGLNSSDRSNDIGSEERYPSLRFGMGKARSMSATEAFARRFHREGLPVARLWENKSALVSLGLNQRGKPGLWLVQKTH